MTQNLDTYAFFVYNNTSHSYKILTVWISRYNDILEDVLGTLYARYLNVLQLGQLNAIFNLDIKKPEYFTVARKRLQNKKKNIEQNLNIIKSTYIYQINVR